jgi:hypothetical protein
MLLLRRLLFYAGMTSIFVASDPGRAESLSLAQRLGYKASDKLLIVNADDTGMCHSANTAVIEALGRGLMRSATIMVPCPWFPEIASYAKANPDKDFGVHLCHTSEWRMYRWGPVAPREQVSNLVDPDGYLWRGVPEVYTNGTPAEALIEGRAQIRRALAAGVDVTHLDSHMGTLQLHPDYLKVYLQLAVEFDLPVRMASQATLDRAGFPQLRDSFAAKGIVFPDHFVYEELKDESKDVKGFWMNVVRNLKPGVTELYIHPAVVSDELKSITGTWQTRSQEYEVFTHDPDMRQLIQEEGVKPISFRPLRKLQREKERSARSF